MKSKILAMDLDGTIIFHEKDNNGIAKEKIHSKDIEALQAFKKAEGVLIISTGRSLSGVLKLKSHGIEYDYLVLCNGALIFDKHLNLISKKIVAKDLISQLFDLYVKEQTHARAFYANDGESTYFVSNPYFDGFQGNYPNSSIIHEHELKVKDVEYTMCSIITKSRNIEEAEALKVAIETQYNKDVAIYRNQHYIDISAPNSSKGNGIKEVLAKLNLNNYSLYSIGDSWNDLSMFKISEASYTFPHAEKSLKPHASFVVDSVADCVKELLIK